MYEAGLFFEKSTAPAESPENRFCEWLNLGSVPGIGYYWSYCVLGSKRALRAQLTRITDYEKCGNFLDLDSFNWYNKVLSLAIAVCVQLLCVGAVCRRFVFSAGMVL